jgi:hypothetical protein
LELKRLRLMESISADCLPAVDFRGVLLGVGSIVAGRDAEARDFCAESSAFRPRAAAALAVPSAVRDPEARLTESAAGWRFFCGDGIGEPEAELSRSSPVLRGERILRKCDARGEGVRFVSRCEILADLRDGQGSQVS